MAIEEKQRALEFTYVPDDIEGELKYDITYDTENAMFPLGISVSGGNRTDYPLGLFTEVVDFLTSKGVIEPKVVSRTARTPGGTVMATSPAPIGAIPLPQIKKKDGTETAPVVRSNIDPLASFDINVVPASPEIPPLTGPVIAESDVALPEEAIIRPVIRSRVKKGDPLSAEKEAAGIRAVKSEASGKTIKRAHRENG